MDLLDEFKKWCESIGGDVILRKVQGTLVCRVYDCKLVKGLDADINNINRRQKKLTLSPTPKELFTTKLEDFDLTADHIDLSAVGVHASGIKYTDYKDGETAIGVTCPFEIHLRVKQGFAGFNKKMSAAEVSIYTNKTKEK